MLLYVFLILSLAISAVIVVNTVTFASLQALWVFPLCFAGGYLALVLLFALVMLLSGVFVDPDKPVEEDSPFHRFMLNEFSRIALFFGGARVHSTGLEKVPRDGRFLLVSNHVTIFDPILFLHQIPWAKLGFIAKKEAFKIFLVGAYLRKTLCLPIDRENDRAALRTVLTAAERLRAGDLSYCVYPEGTRHPAEEMLPFRCGAFKIAQKAGVPIVIAAIRGTDDVCHRFPRTTDVYLDICGVLDADTVKASKTTEIGEVVRECIISAST